LVEFGQVEDSLQAALVAAVALVEALQLVLAGLSLAD
jgi:hypothetical protein